MNARDGGFASSWDERGVKSVLYQLFEFNHAAVAPWRVMADASRAFWSNPGNPLSATYMGRSMAASLNMFERLTRRYAKPSFGLTSVEVNGKPVAVCEEVVAQFAFCDVLHFAKAARKRKGQEPKLLIVAPMSGHFATLLRGTVEAMLPHADVYITDWRDARDVPLVQGRFGLDDYIDYVITMLQQLGPGTHVMAVCQPSVPVLAAAAVMAADDDPHAPASMTLMGGPIDTRRNPTAVNKMAQERGIDWFRNNAITQVPFPNPGAMRHVYPGFMQLTGFMTMNLDRHMTAHRELYWHLVEGDGDSADKHREFYDEYMSVMDLTADFYLETVDAVFVRHALPNGTLSHAGQRVNPALISKTALLTVEGERDDISGVGQTEAAHDLCCGLDPSKKRHHLQMGVGHYGVFNGSRFRNEIAPIIVEFMQAHSKAN
jgi:poly(3-hydroxybutyrate) depolymerase